MKKLLAIAAFVYLLIAPLTYHPDNKLVLRWASVYEGTNWNIWSVPKEEFDGVGQFNYPPLHFYLDKLQYFVSKPIGGEGYTQWLTSKNSTDQNQHALARYSLAIKFPLILFGLLVGYQIFLLAQAVGTTKKQSLIAASIWLFNPITVYSIPIMGQNDVMALSFFLAGWYTYLKRKSGWASILWGFAASIKMFPLLWVPFLLLVDYKKSSFERVKLFLQSVVVYLLTLLPFISNPVFREAVFHHGIDRFFVARIDLGYSDFILIVPILLMILVAGVLFHASTLKEKLIVPAQASLLLLFNLIFLSFNHFHPQWFTWLIPFYSIWISFQSKKNQRTILFASLLCFLAWLLVVILFNDAALTFGLLTPVNPSLQSLPPISFLLESSGAHVSLYNNYAHSFLAGLTLIYLGIWLKNKAISSETPVPLFSLRLQLSKEMQLLLLTTGGVLLLLAISLTGNLIPAPLVSNTPKIVQYLPLTQQVEQSFTGHYNGLNRIDVYLSDLDTENQNAYDFVLESVDGTVLQSLRFEDLNVGFQSTLRVEIPTQDKSKGLEYRMKLIPITTDKEMPLHVGTTVSESHDQFGYRAYYDKPGGLPYVTYSLTQSLKQLQTILAQTWGLFLILPVIAWYGIYSNEK